MIKDFIVYIPTTGRSHHQPSYDGLTAAGIKCVLVLARGDQSDYGDRTTVRADVSGRSIAEKRQWIYDNAETSKFGMWDDDLVLHGTLFEEDTGVRTTGKASKQEVKLHLKSIVKLLDTHAHGGIHRRMFINAIRKPKDYPSAFNKSYYNQAMFFNKELFRKEPTFKGDTAEDIQFFLKLCQQGLDWFVYTGITYVEHEPPGEPERWTREKKRLDYEKLCDTLPPSQILKTRAGRTINFKRVLADAKNKDIRGNLFR